MRSLASTSTIVGLAFVVGLCAVTAAAGEITNGFDTDVIYLIRDNVESQVRKLDETKLDLPVPVHRPSLPTDPVYNMDLGIFGTVCSLRGQDQGGGGVAGKSICFSNSPTPSGSKLSPPLLSAYAQVGARFFGVYEVNDLGENTGQVTYSRTSFQIVEMDSAGRRIRCMQVGLAANIYNDNPDEMHRNHSRDLLTAPHWGADAAPTYEPWMFTRNEQDGCEPGTIRYNKAKNTLAVACVVGEFGIAEQTLGSVYLHSTEYLMGRDPETKAYPRFRVYEFELPDWPIVYYQPGDIWYPDPEADPDGEPIPPDWIGEPVPVYDPALVRLVQIYELPGNIQAANGRNRNFDLRPSIDFDNDGNMYCTGFWYSSKHEPCWGLYNNEYRWMGECVDDFRGDVIRVNTLGHRAGRRIYQVPVPNPGSPNEGDLVIERVVENNVLGHVNYWAPTGMAVRRDKNELVVVCKNLCGTNCMYAHIYDLTQRVGGGTTGNLVLKEVLRGNNTPAPYGVCLSSPSPDPAWYFETPRRPYYAQFDDYDGRTFLANLEGDCGGVANFMSLEREPKAVPDPLNWQEDTWQVVGDVGYALNDGTFTNRNWDAASPPGPPVDQIGGCCDSVAGSCTDNVSQTACYQSGGLWLGKGTVCGQYACPGQGACCKPCGQGCQIVYEGECTGWDETWHGAGSACTEAVCELCSPRPMDGDCDGDVDQADFGMIEACFTGSGAGQLPAGLPMCSCFDRGSDAPGDLDIDSYDADAFEQCASGSGIDASPACLP